MRLLGHVLAGAAVFVSGFRVEEDPSLLIHDEADREKGADREDEVDNQKTEKKAENPSVGGWSDFQDVSAEGSNSEMASEVATSVQSIEDAAKTALKLAASAHFKALKVRRQVVAGFNYMVIASVEAGEAAGPKFACLRIYKPLPMSSDPQPELTSANGYEAQDEAENCA